jgi:hypothetical protein
MTDTPSSPPEKISRYEIRGEIGRGGMATVYLAYDPNTGRDVAIKVLPRELMHDPAFRARFEREARTIAALEHPAIVPVYDFGEEDGQPFLVMRYLSGGSLVSRIRAGPIPPQEASGILSRIGSALDAAHAKGVIHRDLKPANILFDQYGEAYLGDFGIARLSQGGGTLTGSTILGTPAYMSPEQISGEKTVDGRSDIYALGIVAFEMLTGRTPFQADSPIKVMMMHVSAPLPRISEADPQLPPGTGAVLERALAKEPDQRYQTAADFSREFQILAGERTPLPAAAPRADVDRTAATTDLPREEFDRAGRPMTPPPPGAPRKPLRWLPWTAGATAMAVCLLCLAGGGGAAFLNSDFGKWLFAPPPAPLPTATATSTQADTPAETNTPAVEAETPVPTVLSYAPGEPYRLTNGEGVSSHPGVAVDSEGFIHVFWMDKTDSLNGKLFHRALAPDGAWTDPECVSCLVGDPEYVYDYQFAAQVDNKVCVGFQWTPKYQYVVSIACFRGEGPPDVQEVEIPSEDIDFLMAMDPSGTPITLFRSSKSVRAGDEVLSDGSIAMFSPVFGIDSKGGYHLAWTRDSDPAALVYRHSNGAGSAWSSPSVLVNTDMSIASELLLYAGPNGEMHLVISDIPPRILHWKGGWSSASTLAEDFIPYDFAFVTDRDRKVFLLSTGHFSGRRGIWIFGYDGVSGTWSHPSLVRGLDSLMMGGFSAAIAPNGKLLLAYGQNEEGILKGEIYFVEAASP